MCLLRSLGASQTSRLTTCRYPKRAQYIYYVLGWQTKHIITSKIVISVKLSPCTLSYRRSYEEKPTVEQGSCHIGCNKNTN
jgi:hypothetical protein